MKFHIFRTFVLHILDFYLKILIILTKIFRKSQRNTRYLDKTQEIILAQPQTTKFGLDYLRPTYAL